MNHFKDSVAIVTGGASGLGRALCQELHRASAKVIAADIDAAGAQTTVAELGSDRDRARAIRVDVSRADEVERLVDSVIAEHGRLDYMFNNAGIAFCGEVRDMTLEHWHRIMDVNLWGVIHGTMSAYRRMCLQRSGHIVNTASMAGLLSVPMAVPYAASKHAVVGLSLSLRAEAAGLGVRVSAVCPGFVRTRIYEATTFVNTDPQEVMAKVPQRMLDPTKAAQAILGGVRRNKALIVFPLAAKLFWWEYRLHQALLAPATRKVVRTIRALRKKEDEEGAARQSESPPRH